MLNLQARVCFLYQEFFITAINNLDLWGKNMQRSILYIFIVFAGICLGACSKAAEGDAGKQLGKAAESTVPAVKDSQNPGAKEKEKSGTEENTANTPIIEEADYSEYFDGINGCAVFWNSNTNRYKMYKKESCEKRSSPCSSFKIISTLMGLESGAIDSADSTMDYDGTVYPNDSWNKNLGLKDAFRESCIWYFRKVIDQVGPEKVQEYLDNLEYGNCDISEWNGSGINPLPDLNGFWLESSLKISPKEQVEVLARIFDGDTEFSEKNITILKELMLVQQDGNVFVYGKTGTGKNAATGNSDNAWFVGMFENHRERNYFAVRLTDENRKDVNGPKAKEIALNIINRYFTGK